MRHLDARARYRAAVCVAVPAFLVSVGLAAPAGTVRSTAARPKPVAAEPPSVAMHESRPDAPGHTPRSGERIYFPAADATGLVHEHAVTQGLLLVAAVHAAGGASADFDGDGLHDLFVLGGGARDDQMFRNNGDGTFTDVAAEWGLLRRHHAYGASAADFDADGDQDLLVTSYGPSTGLPTRRMFLLLRNDPAPGGGRAFVNVADEAGLNNFMSNYVDGTGSGWGDYNLDGRLDLMICGYRNQHAGNRLYRNEGPDDQGVWRFTDVTVEAGVQFTATQGFLPRFTDLNGDRYPELILIGDTGSSKFLVNNTDGTFTLRNDLTTGLTSANAMGVDVGDVNNDGLLDWYVTNIAYPGLGNVMLMQQPDGRFLDMAEPLGVDQGYWGWGALLKDLDHDGHTDILATNGGTGSFAGRPTVLFRNLGDGVGFVEAAQAMGLEHNGQGRGLIWMDFENDGDQDVVIICNNQPMAVFRNDLIVGGVTPPDANWLRLRLDTARRPTLAPNGIGSMIRVESAQGVRVAPLDNQSNHCTTAPNEAHFGLGVDRVADTVRVTWADGTHTTLSGVDANRILTVSAPAHPADFDGSGAVGPGDVPAFVQAFTAGDLNADLDADWRLTFFDLARFVAYYRDGM